MHTYIIGKLVGTYKFTDTCYMCSSNQALTNTYPVLACWVPDCVTTMQLADVIG